MSSYEASISTVFKGLVPSGPLLGGLAEVTENPFLWLGVPAEALIIVALLLIAGAVWLAYHGARKLYDRHFSQLVKKQQDAIDRYQREQLKLQLQCAHDPLTGAFTRATILEMLGMEAERSRRFSHPFSALLVTVDNMHTLQQHYGMDAVHAVLTDVVKQCQAHVRSFDLVGRYSAEEFIVLLAEADRPTAETIAQRLHRDVAQNPLYWEGIPIGYTITIGYHSLSPAHSCPVTLLERCQSALKRARSAGTSQVACA